MDFTLTIYTDLLKSLQKKGYGFQTFEQFMTKPVDKVVVLRHDIDKLPENAVKIAKIEMGLGIEASYYYRIVKESNVPELIKEVANMGHEIGYHYEDLTLAKGDRNVAIQLFEKNLAYFRTFYPVTTACMHGSPMTKWDNKDTWKDYNYKDYGIIAEPYFDVNYNEVFYITDTGRSWNSTGVSVRDKVDSDFKLKVKSTAHFIELANEGKLPDKIIINTHCQRWFEPGFYWFKELVMQNTKNQVKRFLVKNK